MTTLTNNGHCDFGFDNCLDCGLKKQYWGQIECPAASASKPAPKMLCAADIDGEIAV